MKFYTDVAKITSIADPTINQMCYSMSANSVLVSNINNFTSFPKTRGNLIITCNQSHHCAVRLSSEQVASEKYYEYAYYAKRNADNSVTGSGWKTIYADA